MILTKFGKKMYFFRSAFAGKMIEICGKYLNTIKKT